jgi:hypothetical protein
MGEITACKFVSSFLASLYSPKFDERVYANTQGRTSE